MPDQNMMNLAFFIIHWLLYSIALYLLLRKLGGSHRWMALIPGLRYIALGDTIELDTEGRLCCLGDLLVVATSILDYAGLTERISMAAVIASVILSLVLYIYRIRLFIRILDIFGAKKGWIVLWLVADWLAVLCVGCGKNSVPRENWETLVYQGNMEAGSTPANLPAAMHTADLSREGLSVDLRERTVRDYGAKKYLLKDVALDIPNGSMVLLLGGSGAGKTTLVNAIIGYEKADATILLNGDDVYRNYGRVKYRIGFVPQQNLIRGKDTLHWTVTDAAEMRMPAATPNRVRRTRVREVLDLLGLSSGRSGLVCKKSGGQLRRISIAMELVADPELFVLDEPDSGLDGVIAREIFEKLREIADEGRIVIVITHTPDRVIDLFDKVIVLAKDSGRVGRLAFYGSPEEAFSFFGRDSMEGIVMSVNQLEEGGEGRADEFVTKYAALTRKETEAQT